MVFSFDVFDTLITRSTATPEGIFAIMQERLQNYSDISGFVRNHFFGLRIGAEQVARNTYCKNGVEDVILDQIYHVLISGHKITEEEAAVLQDLERQTEMDHVCGIPENIAYVKKLLADGERVILISDMYLDAETIRRMLVKADDIFQNIPLYVSSEGERKNKYSGNLFRYVKEQEELKYEEWRHYGDNEHSDYHVPKGLGISCELYQRAELLEIEKAYLRNCEGDAGKQLMAGCAKLARIGQKRDAYVLGCSIGGVMLYPYVKWLLEDAVKRGIRRLYFIARDGYILKEMAEELVRSRGLQLVIKYIYGSRKAWRIPDSENLESEIWEIYTRSFQDRICNVSDLAEFLQISDEELKKYLPDRLWDGKRWGVADVRGVLTYLLQMPEFAEVLKKVYARKRRLLVTYLQQEMDTTDEGFAFVDLAGSGYTQECLAKVMGQFYSGTIKNYFYRMDCVKEAECDYFVFYPMFVPYFTILEMMCRAPHEQTIGYAQGEDGKVVPFFAKVDGEAIVCHGVEDFIQGAVRFAKIYDMELTKHPFLENELYYVGRCLEYIYHTPDEMVLNYFADIPNMLTGRETYPVPFAPKLSDRDIREIYWYRESEAAEYYYKGSDLPYSIKRCTDRQKQKIAEYMKYHDSWYGKACRKVHKIFCRKAAAKMICFHDYIACNIAIYGAGKLGQQFYRQITGREKVQGNRYHSQVVLWVDQNYEKYQKEGLPVSSPEDAARIDYEQIIIAVAKKEIADSVREMLVEKGVQMRKIIWIRQFR